MPETPEIPPTKPATTLRAVLDAVSLRLAFALPLINRIDRYQLIEATRLSPRKDADLTLMRALIGRQIEARLALAIHASCDIADFLPSPGRWGVIAPP